MTSFGWRHGALGTFLFLSVAGLSTSSRAEGDNDIAAIVITATRIPTPAAQIASSMTIITADDIAIKQQQTFTEVLRDVPGLNVVQSGGPGGQTSVFMRGTNSNHTKVLIDGIDVGDPSNSTGGFEFGQLLTQDIERVEVLRGPQSGLYGSDAIGGVINVITKEGAGPAQFKGLIEGGSFDTFNQAASINGSAEPLHYSANVTHFHAGASPVTPIDLLPAGQKRNDDYDDNFGASAKLGYDVSPDFGLGLVARYTAIDLRTTSDAFDPATSAFVPEAQQTEAKTDAYYARLSAHYLSFAGKFEQTLGFAYTHTRTSTLQPQTPEALNSGERKKVDWQGNIKAAAGESVVLGAEYERDEISEPLLADTHIASGYAELQSQVGEHWLSALNVRYDDNNRFGSKVTYRFAPAYVFAASGTKLKASIGTGFKAPTLSELFQDFPPFFFANPDLKPETSTGWDAGVEQGFAKGTFRLGVTYFYNRIRNLITVDPVTFSTYANVGRATTDGLESFAEYQVRRNLTLRLDYTYTQATDDGSNQELLRRPKHKANFDASWRLGDAWVVNVDVLWLGSWADGSRATFSPVDAPGYTTVNLAVNYGLTRHLTLFGRIDNLFDRHYENPAGFLQPSIGAFVGLRAAL